MLTNYYYGILADFTMYIFIGEEFDDTIDERIREIVYGE